MEWDDGSIPLFEARAIVWRAVEVSDKEFTLGMVGGNKHQWGSMANRSEG
jgi:hypothetical protein